MVKATDTHGMADLLDTAKQLALPREVSIFIDALHQQYPNPCPYPGNIVPYNSFWDSGVTVFFQNANQAQ